MRHAWLWGAAALMLVLPAGVWGEVEGGPKLTAKAAILVEGDTGAVLWARNADEELPPASTTKVMTAILALESGDLSRAFPASAEACSVAPTKLDLRPGQRLNLRDLVYAILLNSANDASIVIAESLAGSVPAFADRMTARARQLGALNTRFANPHGLTDAGHYSTARDLATLFRHALTVSSFSEIIATKSLIVGIENDTRKIALRSHNRLLGTYRVPVIGKTGYTIPAKKCFVGAGTLDQRQLIVAILGSTDLWGDTRRLLEFGFGDSMPPQPVLQRASIKPAAQRAGSRGRSTAAGRTRRYAVRVGTFDRIEQARRVQTALGRRGYETSINRVTAGKGKSKKMRYSVQVGNYRSRGQAESAVRTIAGNIEGRPQVVQR